MNMNMHGERTISLAHGNGGRYMRELIAEVFARHLGNPLLDTAADAVAVPDPGGQLVVTTDGFTVTPLEFPGGDLGSLAVHGTVNDLAVAGAEPRYLTLNAFIEEGTEIELLDRLAASLARAAAESGAAVVAGDTKVVGRGECGGVFFATTGIGTRPPGRAPGLDRIRPGDRILVSGPVGDHGAAVLLAREEYGLSGELRSDAGSVLPLARLLLAEPGLRFMRDPTRGGLATVACEIARAIGLGLHVDEFLIPISEPVAAMCEILGYDPLYLACEGRIVAVLAPETATAALDGLRDSGLAPHAALIGTIDADPGPVVMTTALGGQRVLDELENDPLPRIC